MASGTVKRTGIQSSLLWTNSDATQSFSAQTIPLNLTDFDAVLVGFCVNTSYSTRVSSQIVLKNGHESDLSNVLTGGTTVRNRGVTVSDSGVTFSAGYQNGSSNNTASIPRWIWGIKGIPL